MKNISLGLVILPLLIISCTTERIDNDDSIGTLDSKVSAKKSEKSAGVGQNLIPENPANVYDYAGKLHNELLDVYLAGNYQYSTILQISEQVQAIAAVNEDVALLSSATSVSASLEERQEIIDNPASKLDNLLANSSMTDAAKISLYSFMNATLLWENEDYEIIYQSIISYESAVMDSTEFNDEDKRVILTTSSIARYSIYYEKKRKDEDWDSNVGNRVGAVSGALDNSFIAIIRSLITEIVINNLVTD
jgi:hypothetical protein